MLLFIGIIIGLVLGLTGAGGSVFAVPLLVLLGGLPITEAIGLSLGAVAASTLYGSLSNWRNKSVLWLPAVILAGSGALTAPLGKWLGNQLPPAGLLTGFSLLAILIAVRMWWSARANPDASLVVRSSDFTGEAGAGLLCRLSPNGQFEMRPRCVSGLLTGGLVVGLMSGLFGVGGGFLIVPLLLFLSQVSMVQAVSSSLVIIAVISSSGFISHLLFNQAANIPTDVNLLLLLVIGGVVGMFIGQRLSRHIANARLQQVFAVCLILISLVTLVTRF